MTNLHQPLPTGIDELEEGSSAGGGPCARRGPCVCGISTWPKAK